MRGSFIETVEIDEIDEIEYHYLVITRIKPNRTTQKNHV